jgi:hypothetical protein
MKAYRHPSDSALTTWSDVGIRAASGCNVSIAATCRDAVIRQNVTVNPLQVQLPALMASWAANTSAITHVSPTSLPVLIVETNAPNTRAPVALVLRWWSCTALLLSNASLALPADLSLGSYSRLAISTSIAMAGRQGERSLYFTDLDGSKLELGSIAIVHAECTWQATGERVRLPPLVLTVPLASLQWVNPLITSVTLRRGGALHVGVQLLLDNVGVQTPASMTCSWESSLLNAGTTDGVQGLPVAVERPTNGTAVFMNASVNTAPGTSTQAWIVCVLWTAAAVVRTPPISLSMAQLSVQFVRVPVSRFFPSSASQPWLLTPSLQATVVETVDTVGYPVPSTCTLLSLTTKASIVLQDVTDTASLITGIPSDARTHIVKFPSFGIQTLYTSGSGSDESVNVSIRVGCTRSDTGDGVPAVLLSLEPLQLRMDLCPPLPSSVSTSQALLPPFRATVTVADQAIGTSVMRALRWKR